MFGETAVSYPGPIYTVFDLVLKMFVATKWL
jgi:hypothetical protein